MQLAIRTAAQATLVVGLTLCGGAAAQSDGAIAAYVVLTQAPDGRTVPLARVVVAADVTCPTVRAGGETLTTSERSNPNPETFPVKLCEAVYRYDVAGSAAGSALPLPVVRRTPARLAIFGDTGCYDGRGQDCAAGPAVWPFPDFARRAAARDPDLVIHLGDYNYRGTRGKVTIDGRQHWVYDAGDGLPPSDNCRAPGPYVSQNVAGSSNWDNWDDWRDDFLAPAAPLFARAPFVFIRGNHELCSRAGLGWFYFLGPGSPLVGGDMARLDCAADGSGDPLRFVPPYVVDAGAIDLAVLDSANACDFGLLHEGRYAAAFRDLAGMMSSKPTWLLSHRPLWGLRGSDGDGDRKPDDYRTLNRTLQRALVEAGRGTLPAQIDLLISGHLHLFQALSFNDGGRPPQIVVGNSGIALAKLDLPPAMRAEVAGAAARVLTRARFGYLELELAGDGSWRGKMWNPSVEGPDHVIANCGGGPQQAGAVCTDR